MTFLFSLLFQLLILNADAAPTEVISMQESLNLRDPFKKPSKYSEPGGDISTPELERYPLDQIKIVGIITGPKKPRALLTTPNNKMYIVQENDKVGNRSGILKKIRDRSIIIREKIVNVIGQEENTDIELKYNQKTAESDGAQQTSGRRL